MSEASLGWYAYCVLPADAGPGLDGLSGVDPNFGLESVSHEGLKVLVSRVRLDEFGSEALKRNLEDLAWLERTARAHDAVLARALACEAVVPLRLCTIYTDDTHMRGMLEREQSVLLDALARLRGHAEWSVKVLAQPARVEEALRQRSVAMAGAAGGQEESPGRAFFARKKRDQALREEAFALAERAAEEAHARLRQDAAAATLLPPQHPELSGRTGQMILNGAYLVERSREGQFAAAADELRSRIAESGLELDVAGPWAPYNFVSPAQPAG